MAPLVCARAIRAVVVGGLVAAPACVDPVAPLQRHAGPAAARRWASDASAPAADATRRRLEHAAAGLVYTSESDHPFAYVSLAAVDDAPLTDAAFRAAASVPPDAVVEERTLDDFFARHIERVDPADPIAVALVPRYQALKRTLRTAVPGVRVFRVGTIVLRCYLVGVDGRGTVVGLTTTAIET